MTDSVSEKNVQSVWRRSPPNTTLWLLHVDAYTSMTPHTHTRSYAQTSHTYHKLIGQLCNIGFGSIAPLQCYTLLDHSLVIKYTI